MWKIFILSGLLFPVSVWAAPATVVEQSSSFEIDVWENAVEEQDLYGTLEDFPHTFQFVADEGQRFQAELLVADSEQHDLSLILIKEEKRGVSEVGRVTGKDAQWAERSDRALGLSLFSSGVFERELAGGVYRLEVSAPDNTGNYRLLVGTESVGGGYIAGIRNAFVAHGHLGSGWWGAIMSPYIYLSLIVVLGGWSLLYWKQKRRKNLSNATR